VDERAVAELGGLLLERFGEVEPAVAGEAPLWPALTEAYFRDRERALAGVSTGGSLKFGLDDAAILITPLALEAARTVWAYLVEEAAKRGVDWSIGTTRRLFGRRPAEAGPELTAPPPELTAAQWRHVHELIVEVLTGPGKIPADRAGLLADAVVGRGQMDEGAES